MEGESGRMEWEVVWCLCVYLSIFDEVSIGNIKERQDEGKCKGIAVCKTRSEATGRYTLINSGHV